MFDRGLEQRRNERAGPLQRREVRRVWVDLGVVYGRCRRTPARPDPAGVDLTARTPGELLEWCRTTTGEWVGWCCVQVAAGRGGPRLAVRARSSPFSAGRPLARLPVFPSGRTEK